MSQVLTGIVHGNTIVLEGSHSLRDGQSVQIEVRSNVPITPAPSVGVHKDAPPDWWTDEDDRILEEIYRARKQSNRPEIPE